MENVNKQLLDALKGLLELHDNPAPFSGKTGEERMLTLESQAAKRNALIYSARQAIATAEQAQPRCACGDSFTAGAVCANCIAAQQPAQPVARDVLMALAEEVRDATWEESGDGWNSEYPDEAKPKVDLAAIVDRHAGQLPAATEGCGACGDGCKGQGCRLERESPPTCLFCNGRGIVSRYAQDGSHDDAPCPDCATPQATAEDSSVVRDAVAVPEAARLLAAIEYAEGMLTNLQPHIPQACYPQHMAFIDNYIDPVLERLRAEIDAAQKGGA